MHADAHDSLICFFPLGDEISMFYDPMIAKLVVWDQNRTSALNRLAEALRDYHVSRKHLIREIHVCTV